MFNRNKNSAPIESREASTEPVSPAVAKGLGGIATPSVVEALPKAPSQELVERAAQQLSEVSDRYKSYTAEAAEKGMDKEDVKASLVSAWNTGAIPRVVPGNVARGSGIEMNVLHGELPDNFFDYFYDLDDGMSGVVLPGSKDAYGSTVTEGLVTLDTPLETLPTTPNPDDPNAFYVETFTLPQMLNDQRFNQDQVSSQLAQIDSLLANPVA